MPSKGPLAIVKEKFGDKEKLVEALEKLTADDLWVARTNKDKGLAHVSNSKLLRLHALFTEVKEKFGTREKLIDALLGLENRSKDQGLRQRYAQWPVPRLYDAYRSTAKRIAAAKAATAKAEAPKARKAAAKSGGAGKEPKRAGTGAKGSAKAGKTGAAKGKGADRKASAAKSAKGAKGKAG